jgi:hypothetical protein
MLEARQEREAGKSRNPKALIDTGSSGCIILNELAKGIHHKGREVPQQWMTKGGIFQTNAVLVLQSFTCPNFPRKSASNGIFTWTHLSAPQKVAKMILGCDLLVLLPLLEIKSSDNTASWQEVTIPVKPADEPDCQSVNKIVEQ